MASSFAKDLRLLTTSKSFSLQYCTRPIAQVDPSVIANPYHPLRSKVLARLKSENTPKLIVKVLATKKKVSLYAVVRNKAVRRVREATFEVLREKGYGREGERLGVGKDGEKSGGQGLIGTLAFWTTSESVLTGWGELKGEVVNAIDKFIALQGKIRRVARNGEFAKSGATTRQMLRYERGQDRTAGEGAGPDKEMYIIFKRNSSI